MAVTRSLTLELVAVKCMARRSEWFTLDRELRHRQQFAKGAGSLDKPKRVTRMKPAAAGYAPVNGLEMYYEVHGTGEPVVLLHGSFMTITNNWQEMIAALSKTRQVIAVEMQGHGRTADIERDFSYESLADDNDLPALGKRVIAMDLEPYNFGADKLRATQAPFFFIHGDADGVRLAHVAEMFRLKGDEIMGDMRPRSPSRLAILPNTTHVTLMQKVDVIAPMITDFLDASLESFRQA